MNFKEILELMDKVAELGLGGVEIDQAGTKVRIEGKAADPQFFQSFAAGDPTPQRAMLHAAPVNAQLAAPPSAQITPAVKAEEDAEAGLHIILSPIVGTFYRAANPESELFVNTGDRITKGKVLCIVEAMKLMNEIESDVDGVIKRIYPQNGQPVEYGEKLFAVKLG